QYPGQLLARRGEALVGAGDGQPHRLGAAGRERQRVGQLAAGAAAERAVVALRRLGLVGGAWLGAGAAMTGLGSPELVADGARVGPQRGADQRRVVVLGGAGQRPVVGKDQVPAVVAALVGE